MVTGLTFALIFAPRSRDAALITLVGVTVIFAVATTGSAIFAVVGRRKCIPTPLRIGPYVRSAVALGMSLLSGRDACAGMLGQASNRSSPVATAATALFTGVHGLIFARPLRLVLAC